MADLTVSQFNIKDNQIRNQFGKSDAVKFDNSGVDAKTGIHALRPKGKLVSSSIFAAPIIYTKDTAEDIVSLKKAVIDGQSDDYKLGRINDLSLKLGSLAIAGYLFTKKNTSAKKWMEFVGFGSFFASMALWPKIFIQAPAKILHGVDVFQEYEDSQGRRKKFFQDPQYIPWDIMTPKQMDKLGDRLNVPRNIKNRSDITKEKAHKIALQSNTMWMLSAGFGVPIMSAFICSAVEKYLPDMLSKRQMNKASKEFTNLIENGFDAITPDKEKVSVFDKFISGIGEKVSVNDTFMRNLAYAITGEEQYAQVLLPELNSNSLFAGRKSISKELIDKMFDKYDTAFENFGITRERFIEQYDKYKNAPESEQVKYFIKALRESGNQKAKRNSFQFVSDFVKSEGTQSQGLSKEAIEYARKLNTIFAKISASKQILGRHLGMQSANTAESLATRHWQSYSMALVKAMNLSSQELQAVVNSDAASEQLISGRLTEIFKSDDAYKKQFGLLYGAYGDFIRDMELEITEQYGFKANGQSIPAVSALKTTKQNVNRLYDGISAQLRAAGLNKTAEHFTMGIQNGNISELSALTMKSIDIPTQAKFSAFSRCLLSFDFFKRKANNELTAQVKEIAKKYIPQGISDADAVKLISDAENLLMKGELADYITKLSTNGDSGLNYKIIMDLLYNGENLSSVTKGILSQDKAASSQAPLFNVFLRNMYETVGNIFNPHFPHIRTDAVSAADYANNVNINIKPSYLQSLLGDSLPSMMRKTCDNIYNTRLWTNKFAKIGIAVAGITVVSQFFFGKLKNDIKIVNNENKNKEAA